MTVQELINELEKIKDKKSIVTIKVNGDIEDAKEVYEDEEYIIIE